MRSSMILPRTTDITIPASLAHSDSKVPKLGLLVNKRQNRVIVAGPVSNKETKREVQLPQAAQSA